MTSNQIISALKHYGISSPENKWLKLTNISVIKLISDSNIYIDANSELYYFDTTNNMLYSTFGKFFNYDKSETDKTAYKHHRIYHFDAISGFINSTEAGPYGSYYTKKFNR